MFNLKNILKNLKKTLSDLRTFVCNCSALPKVIEANSSTVFYGDTITLSTNSNSCALNYQWQELIDGTWTNIEGATDTSYTTGILINPEYSFRLVTNYNRQCYTISNTVVATVLMCEALVTCPTPVDCSTLDDCNCGFDQYPYSLGCPPGVPGWLLPNIQINNCRDCNIHLTSEMWTAGGVDNQTGLPTDYSIQIPRCTEYITPEEYLECWNDYVSNLPSVVYCSDNICTPAYEECRLLCDPEDIDCESLCASISQECYNECLSAIEFVPQSCVILEYSATLTITIPEEAPPYIGCGQGGVIYQEYTATFEDTFGNSQECTVYHYDIAC